jgi:hypothetical protein
LFLILFLIKYSIDYLLILKANSFFNTNKIAIPFASAILYPFFATTVGVFSLFGKFTWKGRRF